MFFIFRILYYIEMEYPGEDCGPVLVNGTTLFLGQDSGKGMVILRIFTNNVYYILNLYFFYRNAPRS